uniref:Uncharacterized protein n=1 Tax=Anguilla anguilla TaxID=7936 RepID=A0A0E9THS2_ANGAN
MSYIQFILASFSSLNQAIQSELTHDLFWSDPLLSKTY